MLIVLEAAAGLGKSRLLDAAAELADGFDVLRGRGDSLAREVPYSIVRDLFVRPLVSVDDDERDQITAGAAGLAAGVLLDALPDGGGHAGAAFEHGLYWLIANLAARRPLLLLVDDAHWADRQSLQALAFVARRLDDLPVALVLATRPQEPDAPQDLLDRLVFDADLGRIEPRGLGAEGVAAVVRQSIPDASDEVCAAAAAATDGNPFYLGELLTRLVAGKNGAPLTAEEVARIAGVNMARTLMARHATLPAEAHALARAVAVLGDGTPVYRAASLAGQPAASASVTADHLTQVGLLKPERPLTFAHSLVRTAVYDAIPPGERSDLHRRAARLLHAESAGNDAVSAHLLSCEPAGEAWASQALSAAAIDAARRGAPDAAAGFLVRALAEPPAPEQRPDIEARLGLHALQANLPDAAAHLLEAFNRAPDPLSRAEIGWGLAQAYLQAGRALEALPLLDEARAALGDAHPQAGLRLEIAAMDLLRTDADRQQELRDRLGRAARASAGSGPLERVIDAHQAWEATVEGLDAIGAVQRAERALAAGEELLDAENEVGPAWFMAVRSLMVADRFDDAHRHLTAALDRAQRRGARFAFATASWYRADVEFRRGRLSDAEADGRLAYAIYDPSHGLFPAATEAVVNALVRRGEAETAEAIMSEHGFGGRLPEAPQWVGLTLARGRLRVALGDVERGLADILAAGELRNRQLRPNPGWNPWRSDAALALLALGQDDRALELAREEFELAQRWQSPRAVGIALRTLGLAENDRARLSAAVRMLERSGAELEHAVALVELGAAARAAGDVDEARDALRLGLDIAARCGATPLADRAREQLVASGARPRRSAATGVDALTPAERRVCELAGEGLTNRQVAESLFLTVKTVEGHLGRAYRKLGISGKADLAAALA